MANELLKFKHGLWPDLKNKQVSPGTVYITRDERAMYIDLPAYQKGDGTTEDPKRIRIGDMRIFEQLSDLTDTFAQDATELTKSALYYVEKNNDGTPLNGLYKWTGSAFIRLNDVSDVTADLSNLTETIGTLSATVTQHGTEIAANAGNITTLQGEVANIKNDYLLKTDASSTYATKTELDNEKAVLIGNENDAPTANTIWAAKKAADGANQIATQANTTAQSGVNKAEAAQKTIDDYKTANDNALAQVSQIANNAATNTALQEEIARADAAEKANAAAITELNTSTKGQIDALDERVDDIELFFTSAENSNEVIDTLKEIQNFIDTDASSASAMLADIQANKEDIAELQENSALKSEVTTLDTKLSGLIADGIQESKQYTNDALAWGQF